ncbi:MAG: PEP-CTERM sorting domain-containing protein [Akkermansiaceae bacterium]|nr:PEP-CTERM sorting domain-containing protein [Akkermansiaceae bacterium]
MTYPLFITTVLTALTMSANAAVVAFHVSGNNNGALSYPGVLDTTTRNWSQIGSQTDTSDSVALDAMTVTATVDSGTWSYQNDTVLDVFDRSYYAQGTPMNVTISGLDNAQTYNLAVFMRRAFLDRGALATVNTVGATNPPAEGTTGDDATSYIEGTNYVLFEGLSTDGAGNITFAMTNGVDNFTAFNGFEIQNVPEPSSAALLGLGGLALILRRRQ